MIPRILIALCLVYLAREAAMHQDEDLEISIELCEGCGRRLKQYKLFDLSGRQVCAPCKEFWGRIREMEGSLPVVLS